MPSRAARHPRLIAAAAAFAAAALCLVAAAPPASAQSSVRYVALGDSYSSGLGAGSYTSSSGSCDRSTKAYSQLWANANAPASYVSVACAGATTGSVISTQLSALSSATTLVSITIGGNDVGFSSTMETCVLESTSSCVSAIDADEAEVTSVLPGELDNTLGDIAGRAPGARVVVLGYPELYDLSQSWICIGLSTTDRTDLNQAADELDSAIQAAAARHGDTFVNVQPNFAGHEICDSSSWLHSVNFLDLSESYHPTAAGQADAYYPAFSSAAG
ncbi:MAG TPA: SGNH/GDSL hydrolase family protein [Streptosporangiaceae bacterium]|nr:SGNH/GDSL hydrolase family protein [Streptosporangiaceae bacterium]